MNQHEAIRHLMKEHRSIRRFKDKAVSQAIIDDLIECAQWAPSSHNVQAYSIICIRNKDTKQELKTLCGDQSYISECPVFFVFVMDFYRHSVISACQKEGFEINETENILVGAVDTALVAENFLLAARSYGLGGVMIGGIRNEAEEVAKLLKLPPYTVPIMGMCVGYPDQAPEQKPRLLKPTIYHEEVYQLEGLTDNLSTYNQISEAYYLKRANSKKNTGWIKQMQAYFGKIRRAKLTKFINDQGFSLK